MHGFALALVLAPVVAGVKRSCRFVTDDSCRRRYNRLFLTAVPAGRTIQVFPEVARSRTKNKVYLVDVGGGELREFTDWPTCQAFVSGKPYAFAGGPDRAAALAKLDRSRGAQLRRHGGSGSSGAPRARPASQAGGAPPSEGICADAGTHGNPGPCEFQVCDLAGRQLMHRHLGVHTNNYAELAGIAAMIEQALGSGERLLWTDSQIAMGWIASGRVGPTVHERTEILAMCRAIKAKLDAHPELELRKWDTRNWGEIPADFGRK